MSFKEIAKLFPDQKAVDGNLHFDLEQLNDLDFIFEEDAEVPNQFGEEFKK
jgi:hypothetical protein